MQDYFIPSHVYWSRTEDGIVFLDLNKGKYFGIGHRQLGADEARELEAMGLVTRESHLGRPFQPISLDIQDAIPFREHRQSTSPVMSGHVVRFGAAWLRARLKLKCQSLERIVHGVELRKRCAATRPFSHALRELAILFRRLQPLIYTSKAACVLDSLVLVEFLAAHGHYPQWVFGVKTQPFAAHSWVQSDGLVLNDTTDRVRAYAPILVI